MDGGFVDNSGLDSLAYLLGTLHHLERVEPDDARTEAAGRILDRLRHRGVLLVEIDSGAKSHSRGVAEVIFPSIFEPVRSLNNAVDGNAGLASARHVATISEALTDLHEGKVHRACQVHLQPPRRRDDRLGARRERQGEGHRAVLDRDGV